MIGVYKITSPTGKVYVGESLNVVRRWNQYKNGHTNKQWKLERSIKKYGWESHEVELIESCCVDLLRERERFWQLHYNSVEDGLNLKLTGAGDVKTKDSVEVTKNRSKGQMGRKQSKETKQKLSQQRIGVAKPREVVEKIRLAKLGSKLSEQHKASIGRGHMKQCVVDGQTYESCKTASAALQVPARTLNHRLNSKNYPNCWFI